MSDFIDCRWNELVKRVRSTHHKLEVSSYWLVFREIGDEGASGILFVCSDM
jgi:hypothetical protein